MRWKKLRAGTYESDPWTIEQQDTSFAGRYRWFVYYGARFVGSAMTFKKAKYLAEHFHPII